MNRRDHFRLGALALLAAGTVAIWWFNFAAASGRQLTVAFLDIGQGDSIYIESPTGGQALIDGGPNKSVVRRLSEVMPFYDRSIDVVIATHPDKDHIGGLPAVFDAYNVSYFLEPGNESDTAAYAALEDAAEREGSEHILARAGETIDLGGGATLEILFPDRDVSNVESNTASIVAKLTYGDTTFLFTGDSPRAIETYLVAKESGALDVDVLKAGHHGSRTSSAPAFIAATSPEYAVISAGKDNQYGHPHQETLDTLTEFGVTVVRTDEEGTITFLSDGRMLKHK